jgi:hypothetical protein
MIDCSAVREESLNSLITILKEDSLHLTERGSPCKRARASLESDDTCDQPELRRSKRLRRSDQEDDEEDEEGTD